MAPAKALVLLSGGLDSLLAVKVLEEQGITVTGITFTSPFFGAANAQKGADQLGIDLIIDDITDIHVPMVKNPPHGYGKQMNPCIDCHAMMVRRAGAIMTERGFDLLATGEVLGERPMSQNRQSLDTVARDSGFADLLLRPLSALLLPETRPEREGKIDRMKLLAIEGRSRQPQMVLARKYGIRSYVQPAGGCLLTDPHFSLRLRELLKHDTSASVADIHRLKLGRHYRFEGGAKLIMGRNESDNGKIETSLKTGEVLFISEEVPGPTAILTAPWDRDLLARAASYVAAYADNGGKAIAIDVVIDGARETIRTEPADKKAMAKERIE